MTVTPETKVNRICHFLFKNPGRVLLHWHPTVADRVVPISKMCLMCAYLLDGKYIAKSFMGTSYANKIKFLDDMVRIKNGPRTGLILDPKYLNDGEYATPVGIKKKLDMGTTADRFRESAKKDMSILDILYAAIETATVEETIKIPKCYLAVKRKTDAVVRICVESTKLMQTFDEFDDDKDVRQNFNKLRDWVCIGESKNRFLFPHEICSGKGILLADLKGAEKPFLVPQGTEVNNQLFKIRI